jgi:hypothetical protein
MTALSEIPHWLGAVRYRWLLLFVVALPPKPGLGQQPDPFSSRYCRPAAESFSERNQSKLAVQLVLSKGKPKAGLAPFRFLPSREYCAHSRCLQPGDGTLAPSDKAALEPRLLERINAPFGKMPRFDQIAAEMIVGVAPPSPMPLDPEAPEEEQERFRREKAAFDKLMSLRQSVLDAAASMPEAGDVSQYGGDWMSYFTADPSDQNPPPLEKWRRAAANNATLKMKFETFAMANGGRPAAYAPQNPTFNRDFVSEIQRRFFSESSPLAADLRDSPLVFDDGTDPDAGNDPNLGLYCFSVTDPVSRPSQPSIDSIAVRPEFEAADVFEALENSKVFGRPWSVEEINSAIVTHYFSKGYNATANVDVIGRSITVMRITIASISLPVLADAELYKVLRTLLPQNAFEEVVRNERAGEKPPYLQRPAREDPSPRIVIDLKTHFSVDNEERRLLEVPKEFLYANSFVFARISAALQSIGYISNSGSAAGDPRTLAATPVTYTIVSDGKPQASTSGPREAFQGLLEATLYRACPKGSNHFFGGLDIRPEQGKKWIGGYECLKAGPGRLRFTGSTDDKAGGSLGYATAFPAAGRIVSLGFDLSTDYTRNRLLAGTNMNERRKGGTLRLTIPVSSPASLLQRELVLEGKRQSVELLQGEERTSKQNLTLLNIAGRLFREGRATRRPFVFEVRPEISLGLGLAATESAYQTFTVNQSLHWDTSDLFAVDIRSRYAAATSKTPVFQAPSFGGASSVRGFREDSVLALRTWSIQPEGWMRFKHLLPPVFDPSAGGVSKLKQFIGDNIAVAGFTDIGGAYRTLNSIPGVRKGYGAGLRLIYGKAASFRLDWAKGISNDPAGSGRGRFYFSLDLLDNPL